ncbi:hypothetical protein BTR25_23400 [Bacillus sp. MRMR6]|nr:hypothetical protein BTR25_23400 [Bacillus sp. MRMR6]
MFAEFPGNIYALSSDTVKHHQELKEELGLEFTILSDEKLKLIQEAGMKDPQAHKSLRGFAILDKDGKIIAAQEVNPFGIEMANIITYANEKLAK